jgi:hypothetical protein
MSRSNWIIEKEKDIINLLEACKANHTVFEAKDSQENLYSLALEHIMNPDASRIESTGPMDNRHLLTRFKPLQQGSSELRLNSQYAFSFLNGGTTYSFFGTLLNSQPNDFLLTFELKDEIFRLESRRSQRISTEELIQVSAEIDETIYRVVNLSIGGVGILIPESDTFQIGQNLNFNLLYEGNLFCATGTIKHIAPLSGGEHLCGIALTYHNEESIEHIRRFIHETR